MKKEFLIAISVFALIPGAISVDNVTVELAFNPSEVIIDGSTVTAPATVNDFENPFISSDDPTGLVGYSSAEELRYRDDARSERIEIVQSGSSGEFLIPHTEGGYSALLNREQEIEDRSILNLRPPTFAFEQIDSSVSVIYSFAYPVTEITGPQSGLETIVIRNRLDSDNETQFVLRTE